jgi:carbamoyl-phosphate synthase small subunit
MSGRRPALLALADGTVFTGRAFGAEVERVGEVVFNTALAGYQETLTDPSYVEQILVFTVPELGNVGVNAADTESAAAQVAGVVCKHLALAPSNWRSEGSLEGWLESQGIPGIEGIDTRRLVRHLRDGGVQMGVLSTKEGARPDDLVDRARAAPGMAGRDLATEIGTKRIFEWTEGTLDVLGDGGPLVREPRYHVVAYDYGHKRAMLRLLVDAGCRVTVVPPGTPAAEALGRTPDGIFLTNGPGDPAAVAGARDIVASLLGKVPVFGICLGHQILSLALGARTYKLKFGHRGANHPVQELATGKVAITSQNHGFAVDEGSLVGTGARASHVSLNDGTNEGIEVPDARAFSVQYHPEASPGPHDARPLFARFVAMMEAGR